MNASGNDSQAGVDGSLRSRHHGAVGISAAVAVTAFLAVVATLDTAGVLPTLAGPGITSDEPFDAAFGKQYVVAWRRLGFRLFTPANIEQVFGGASKDHPPLGRWLLGWAGRLFDVRPDDASRLLIAPYRLAPALAFAVLVFLVAYSTGRWYGRLAGAVAGASLILMPRVFGHAHLAALDTFVALAYSGAVLVAHWAFSDGRYWKVALAGIVWGAALLVKMQGFLVLAPVGLWAIGRAGERASERAGKWASERAGKWTSSLAHSLTRSLAQFAVWTAVGFATFFAGWQWLWIRPIEHLREYLGRATERGVIEVWYFGQAVADRELPWHYPWVMFAVTVPVGLHLLGVLGVARAIRRRLWGPHETLLAASGLFPLLIFSLPGVVVYDGVRLFLMVFPMWAVFVGLGGQTLFDWLASATWAARPRLSRRAAALILAGLLACQGVGVVWFHPYQLSYYNLLVGGLWGAERLGLEVTYWGDTVDGKLLQALDQEAEPGACALFAPSLYHGHADAVQNDFLALHADARRLEGDLSAECKYLVVYNRKPYLREPHLPPELVEVITTGTPIFEHRRQSVWLARVYRLQ